MKVPVMFFGQLAEQFGRQRDVDIPAEGCTIGDLREKLTSDNDHLAFALGKPGIRAAIDQEIVGDDAMVTPRHEIAFFSPVSGG